MPALSKMAFGNKLGFEISADVKEDDLFAPAYGCIVAEVPADKLSEITTAYTKVGTVKDNGKFTYKEVSINVEEALSVWADTLEGVFPTKASKETTPVESKLYEAPSVHVCKNKVAKPQYLSRYSQELTVSTIVPRHLKEPVLIQSLRYSRTLMLRVSESL